MYMYNKVVLSHYALETKLIKTVSIKYMHSPLKQLELITSVAYTLALPLLYTYPAYSFNPYNASLCKNRL